MDNCLFCKIIRGEIPSTKVYEDESVYAFRDINPQAPVHVLVVPKKHYKNVSECAGNDPALAGEILKKCALIAQSEGLANGFRLITNNGPDACQSVEHMHVHILGGAKLTDKMG
jgi:histidine triad (HIT) family protein